MAAMVRQSLYVPFEKIHAFRLEENGTQEAPAAVFYAQSSFMVEFLVAQYGHEAFRELCRHLRDGKSFEEALKKAYYPNIDSMVSFERQWVKYMGLGH